VVNGRVQTHDVEGLVESVNATAPRLAARGVNAGRFHPVELPEAGTHVRIKVDAKG
jgi:hypothetical protein